METKKLCPRCKKAPALYMYCRPCGILAYLDVKPVVYGEKTEPKA